MKLNPFASLVRPKHVFAWGMYDLANQSFVLLINTLLFAIFFKEVIVGDPQQGDALWSATYSASMLLVVLLSPLAGALADCRGWRKLFLIGTGLVCCGFTAALGFTGPGLIVLAIALYIPANIAFQIGENFLASFLPSVSTPRNIGRVSAIGWTMGYVGALCLLILTATGMATFSLGDPADWSPFFMLAAAWFLLNMIPAWRTLEEPRALRQPDAPTIAHEALYRLRDTAKDAQRYRQLVRFLAAFFVFAMGVQVVVAFASILARDFGFGTTQLVLFVLQLTVTAGIAAAVTARFQDRVGARATVIVYLGVWIGSAAALFALSLAHQRNPDTPQALFWIVGNGIGVGLGGIGTASRSLVGRFTPTHKTAEFFGLWGMVYKGAGVVGVLSFGQVKAWIGMPASLALLAGFFVAGLLLVLRVNERAGLRAAQRASRDANR